jgi:hypothetical protein
MDPVSLLAAACRYGVGLKRPHRQSRELVVPASCKAWDPAECLDWRALASLSPIAPSRPVEALRFSQPVPGMALAASFTPHGL